jgi:hypothetical protein
MIRKLRSVLQREGHFLLEELGSPDARTLLLRTVFMHDLHVLVAGLDKSIASECVERGAKCRDLEAQRTAANERLVSERTSVKAAADPQAAAIGVAATSRAGRLHGGAVSVQWTIH